MSIRLLTLPEMPTFFVRLDILTDLKGTVRGLQIGNSLGVGGRQRF